MASFFTPKMSNKLTGVGAALSQLSRGNAIDLSPYLEANREVDQREAAAKAMADEGLMSKFTPEQRKVLASLPPDVAQQVVAEYLFTPTKTQETFRQLGADEVAGMGLEPGSYQISEVSGKVSKIGGGGVTVNTGDVPGPNDLPGLNKLPPGMTYVYDDNGLIKRDADGVPMVSYLPGSEEYVKQQEREKNAENKKSAEEAQGLNVDYTLDSVIVDVMKNPTTTGLAGSVTGRVAGTPAFDLREKVSTLQSIFSFEKLQEIRDNSVTGGGLGNVTDNDLRMLANNIASLNPDQGREQLLEQLYHVKEIWRDILARTPKDGDTSESSAPTEYIWNPETGELE